MKIKVTATFLVLLASVPLSGCRGEEDAGVQEFETVPPNAEVVDTVVAPRVPPAPE